METIALLAQKGGTGKTTLAVHLAVIAALEGKDLAGIEMTAPWAWIQEK